MINREAAAKYKTDLRCASHLFDAHAMGFFDLTTKNIDTLSVELRRIADELELVLIADHEAKP